MILMIKNDYIRAIKATNAFLSLLDINNLFRELIACCDLNNNTFYVVNGLQHNFLSILTYHDITLKELE